MPLAINFCEIFGVVRFSTFATLSAFFGPRTRSEISPLIGQKRACSLRRLNDDAKNKLIGFFGLTGLNHGLPLPCASCSPSSNVSIATVTLLRAPFGRPGLPG